ncbi:MAG: hypothetical protein JWN66_3078 [Sphingomonas bacterium]|uniref:hypothetical protein n=1 Tax=Sphingomonas bacterium TaxID=1895847 RepID=UPI002633C68E|nr:hypothetical protein [Sphingomonas bacterium]MDB5705962.1 hypothetical protein [Sphingomonas bacterium]
MKAWILANLAKAIAIAVFVLLIVGLLGLRSCRSASTARTEERLATGQRDAAFAGVADSSTTTDNVQANVIARATTVKENNDAIDEAPAGDANDAADRATCRLRSYRRSVKCIALLGPVAP